MEVPKKKSKKTSKKVTKASQKASPKLLVLAVGILVIALFFLLLSVARIGASAATTPEVKGVDSSLKSPEATHSPTPSPSPSPSPTLSPSPSPSPSPKPSVSPSPALIQSGKSVRVPILMYHYIGNNPNPADKLRDNLSVAPDKFEEQMKYLADNGYTTITFDTLYAGLKGGGLPAKPVLLTFDDGYIDFYLNAYQILRKYNLKATVFIPTGLMNQGYYLTWDQIKEMNGSGLISFEAHSVGHVNLPSMSGDQLTFQLTESKKVLESQLGKPVNFMAYPYGTSNSTVQNAVKKAGYLGSVGTWYGNIESEGTQFNWPRIKVAGTYTIEQFANRL